MLITVLYSFSFFRKLNFSFYIVLKKVSFIFI